MTWLRIAAANLRNTPLTSGVNVILLALGTASIVLLLLAGEQFAKVVSRDARGIDLVLGAKGSPVQLVLSSVYHADIPTGNIPLAKAHRWAEDPRVERAVPLSLGDSYKGFRIVGTTPEYARIYAAEIHQGHFWNAPMQAVVGAAVARETRLGIDSRFAGAHGLAAGGHEHNQHPYHVVGVLKKTGGVLDRLILTDLNSVWVLHGAAAAHHEDEHHVHEHDDSYDQHDDEEREITAMLITYASPLAATSLPRQINTASNLQAASPAFELSRLLHLVGLGLDGLRAFAGVLLLTAGFSVFAALYGALQTRRFDLAMLRCLGATRGELMLSLLLEGLLLAAIGVTLGFALGHGGMMALGSWLENTRGVAISGLVWLPQETWLLLALLGIGVIAAALPAWQAYRNDVAGTLAEA